MAGFYSLSTYLKAFAVGILLAAAGIGMYAYAQSDPSTSTAATPSATAVSIDDATMTVYSSPTCGCCAKWVTHLEDNGFTVEHIKTNGLGAKKQELGIPRSLSSCHTGVIGDYVVEGHVPAEQVKRLLAESPNIEGLSVPGMPIGSPGMEQGDTREPYDVVAFQDDKAGVFASYHKNE
jgi:hypothetical protein